AGDEVDLGLHPFNPEDDRPRMKKRWPKTKAKITGTTAIREAANTRDHSVWCALWNVAIAIGSVRSSWRFSDVNAQVNSSQLNQKVNTATVASAGCASGSTTCRKAVSGVPPSTNMASSS